MESQGMLQRERVFTGNMSGSNGDSLVDKEGCAENGSEDLGDVLLENLDSYLDDINDRLTISRMVSNAVIKGMVNALEQEAAEKIAAKELEVANLEFFQFYNAGLDKIDCLGSSMGKNELGSRNCVKHLSFEEACLEHDMVMEFLKGLTNVADQQLKKLKNGIHGARGSSIRKINSGSELVGLGGILLEKDSKSWVHVDRLLDSLKMTVDHICSQANSMLMLSKSLLGDWYFKRELQSQLEAMVMQSLIQSIQEEFEQKLWDQSSQLCCSQTVTSIEKLNQISSLRMELDAILKSLSSGDGQPVAHGSQDADHFHRKLLSNHVTSSTTLWEGNGKLEASDADVPESYDAAQLKHMSKEQLVGYFNDIITKMRRNHESTVQELTEEYFSLKREYLKERGASLPLKKDKEFDMLRKKIPDVILKLDDILIEKEMLPVVTENADNISSFKDRLDSLLCENHQLRDSLRDKKNELKCISSQLSDATQKMLQHSSAEADMLKRIGKLNSYLEDAHIEAAINKDVQKCILVELIGDIRSDTEELDLDILLKREIYDIIFSGAAANVESTTNCNIEVSDVESLINQGVSEVIFQETLKDARKEIKDLYVHYLIEKQQHTSFEMEALEKENELKLQAERNERLKHEISVLAKSLDEREEAATNVSVALTKEREQFELTSQELDGLREEANQQRMLASEISKELNLVNDQLAGTLEQIESDKIEMRELKQKLEQALNDLEDANEQRKMVAALTQEKHDNIQLVEAKEREHKMQIEAILFNVQGLSKMLDDFEFKVSGKIKANKLRYLFTAIFSCLFFYKHDKWFLVK
jgi:hypothetical protein